MMQRSALLVCFLCLLEPLTAFAPMPFEHGTAVRLAGGATTIEPPTREKTDRKTGQQDEGTINDDKNDDDYPDMEYLIDSSESREMDDPFHILLLGATFEKPKVTIPYVAGSLDYVLGMPHDEGVELSRFAKMEGFSCLGTWPREECLTKGRQLQMRDIVCRVVPFAEGGQRGWQAKDASSSSSSAGGESSNGDSFM
jgi:hypothetical protein